MIRTNINSTITVGVVPGSTFNNESAGILNYGYNAITNSANPYGSVQLPNAVQGAVVIGFVIGVQFNYLSIWPKFGSSEQINGVSVSSDFIFPTNNTIGSNQIFIAACSEDGQWTLNCPID